MMGYTNKATKEPYMEFICNPYEHETSVNTRVKIEVMQKDLSRDDMIQVLEDFMKAVGYRFGDKECLGIEVYD